jgi:hypothetical protein
MANAGRRFNGFNTGHALPSRTQQKRGEIVRADIVRTLNISGE